MAVMSIGIAIIIKLTPTDPGPGILENYCKKAGIYRKSINYEKIYHDIKQIAGWYDLDKNLVFAIAISESELNHNVVNTNTRNDCGKNIDIGMMQINLMSWEHQITDIEKLKGLIEDDQKRTRVMDILFDPAYNICVGCFVLKTKIREAKGNIYDGVRRYNGAGPKAELYAKKVMTRYYRLNMEGL